MDGNTHEKRNGGNSRIKFLIAFLALLSVFAFCGLSVIPTPQHGHAAAKVLVTDTFPCDAGNDSLASSKLSIPFTKTKLNLKPNTYELDVYNPVFYADENATLLFYVKEISDDTLKRQQRVRANLLSNYYTKTDTICSGKNIDYISKKRVVFHDGDNFYLQDLEKNIRRQITFPKPIAGKAICSAGGNYIFSNGGFRVYRYSIDSGDFGGLDHLFLGGFDHPCLM